ncbi:MAG: PadR family transcriptional regulator [Tenericutes bacterium HGW-Tenericutes-8]|nr:MAG: PadR family transcriptional regulator [Tenericutes bacterium HGW-Tenericutes-8]
MDKETLRMNLETELKRGVQTLAVLSLLKEKQYGYSLLEALSEKNMNIEAGTLYPMLRRLETQGLLASSWDLVESRPRKYYSLSQLGEEMLDELMAVYKKMSKDLAIWL